MIKHPANGQMELTEGTPMPRQTVSLRRKHATMSSPSWFSWSEWVQIGINVHHRVFVHVNVFK